MLMNNRCLFALFLLATLNTRVFEVGGSLPGSQEADRVEALPGQPQIAAAGAFNLYAGNVTVDVVEGRDLFYVFAECSNDTAGNKPLVLWLNGGPGCSSLASGFAQENGPFRISPGGTGLLVNDFAWNTEVNMIWLESPTGVGFSYARRNVTANVAGDDTRTAEDAYNFLLGWLARFPQYQGRDFYLTGESYAGHYVPELAKMIVERNPVWMRINLKGFMVGNPDIDDTWDSMGTIDYYYSHAMISSETYNGLKENCHFDDPQCCSSPCNAFFTAASIEIGNIDYYSVTTDVCTAPTSAGNRRRLQTLGSHTRSWNPILQKLRGGYDPCTDNYGDIYFNRPDVQQALHANVSGIIPYKWAECSSTLSRNWTDAPSSMIPIYHELIAVGLKIWVYSGDLDSVVSVTSTRYSIQAMKLPVVEAWQPWYDHQQVGGRIVVYTGLTFVTIKGAGHQVPRLQPARFLQLLRGFVRGQTLPNSPFQ